MVTQSDYPEKEVQLCRSVLLEIMTILGQIIDNIVIIGGHVPSLALPESTEKYQGTMDVDLALDFQKIDDTVYKTIVEILKERGYYQKGDTQPFKFFRDLEGNTYEIDLLAGEYGGTGKARRHQTVQDAKARKARGCDLVFDRFLKVRISGQLPSGVENSVVVKVANIGPFLITKGMALYSRVKEKDAYDIYYCIKNFKGGYKALAEEIKPLLSNKLVKEGLGKIRSKFETVNSIGPNFVADFYEITESEEREIKKRDAFEQVKALLDELSISPYDESLEEDDG